MSNNKTGIKITADILSFEKGLDHYENVNRIRLDSKDYKLLIMSDYIPIIGELNGNLVLILDSGEEKTYQNIHGFYRHSHNEFEFILKGKADV